MRTKILAVNWEPVEVSNGILSYVQLFLPADVGLNLHPLAPRSHLHSTVIQQENKPCCFASRMAFKLGSERCLLEHAVVVGGTTARPWSAGVVGIFDCRLLTELLSQCDSLRLVFYADGLGFKPSARSQTANVWEEGRTCCTSAVITCGRCRFKFWLCYRFPMWPCTNIPVHQLP